MHVLLVSIAFPPKKDPECLQTAKYFKYLVREGVSISVVTSAIPTLNMDYDPSLKKYDTGFNQKLEYRISENKYLNFLIRKLFPSYLQTPDSKKRFVKHWKKVIRDLQQTPDIIYSRSFPLSSALTALKLKEYYQVPWVMHLSDPWADAPWVSHEHGIYSRNKDLEKSCFEKADKICFTTDKTYEFYSGQYPQFKSKFEIFPNVYDPDEMESNSSIPRSDKLRIVYTGGLSGNRGPQHIIKVVEHLRKKGFDVDNKLELVLAGEMDRRNRSLLEQCSYPYLQYLGRRSYEEARELQKTAHLLLIIEEPMKDVSKAMFFPSKILDYLMAGRKMFAITSKNSQVDISFRKSGWESFDHNELEEAATFIETCYGHINQPDYFIETTLSNGFNAQTNTKRLINLLNSL